MTYKYIIGIDGGGTHCRGRLLDRQGKKLAEYTGKSANIFSDYHAGIAEVERVIEQLFVQGQLDIESRYQTHIVAGLAGANVPSIQKRLQAWQPICAQHSIFSDVETACIGAHQAKPGAVLVIGTGSQGTAWDGEKFTSIGGWGFMLSDLASGAVLGQKALRLALLAHEGIVPHTQLTRSLMTKYQNSPEQMLLWSTLAQPSNWAECVRAVFHSAEKGDEQAKTLLKQTATDAELMIKPLLTSAQGAIALLGGVATPLTPWLSKEIRSQLTAPQGDALDGAILISMLKIPQTVKDVSD